MILLFTMLLPMDLQISLREMLRNLFHPSLLKSDFQLDIKICIALYVFSELDIKICIALYVFSENESVINQIRDQTLSGGFTVNDTILQLSVEELPFGGVGSSGTGAYHGKHGFLTPLHITSSKKSCLRPEKNLGEIYSTKDKI
ncbi:aldehyde dehydrogenase family 3 member B1 [Eurytemora carolleeae]|uniref:aldehyde dehydrogenase family 3 member B1 n=1 Tax=Eurytemora carolleeae TaxID=1294199 RepID=UPI000C764FC6|nr:aldehyde dehydrogenase family 3 member B1 [Eurytemora carolleeae]|eukprot:XP_023348957.1 aldehyde dehydrogenase family 3 member B1-like [Eurytemora affinis]